MNPKMKVGPLLGVEDNSQYTVCFLSDMTLSSCDLFLDGANKASFKKITDTHSGQFWRAEFPVDAESSSRNLSYEIQSDGTRLQDASENSSWTFHVPGTSEKPRIAYASCNGFSSAKLIKKTRVPYYLWERMCEEHKKEPLSLLIMGGDQLYADEIWDSSLAPTVVDWSELSRSKMISYCATATMPNELDCFYETLYAKRWSNPHMAHMMASVPTVMMWDDHDIFDGWGSYKPDLQDCKVFQAIFQAAWRYFDLFQLRSCNNKTLLKSGAHGSFGLRFRDYLILGLDNRSERTRNRVMSPCHWNDIKRWLKTQCGSDGNLLVLSAIPVVYRSFAGVETILTATPWEEESEDDVLDHWSAREHQGERMKLIMNLMDFVGRTDCRCIILSGDVHVGALGIIRDTRDNREIHQLISSGIVHPPPNAIEWLGLRALTSDDKERIGDGQITTEMICPFRSDKYIRARNYAVLKEGTDDKLWVNWICEGEMKPEYGIS